MLILLITKRIKYRQRNYALKQAKNEQSELSGANAALNLLRRSSLVYRKLLKIKIR